MTSGTNSVLCGGKDKRPNVHMQRCCSACGVWHHRHGPIAVKRLSAPYEAARTPVFSQPALQSVGCGQKFRTIESVRRLGCLHRAQRVGGWYETWQWHNAEVRRASTQPLVRWKTTPGHKVCPCSCMPSIIIIHPISRWDLEREPHCLCVSESMGWGFPLALSFTPLWVPHGQVSQWLAAVI